jgi:hypothetical protein
MSTRCSLEWDEGYHLYEEAADGWNVYLELENSEGLKQFLAAHPDFTEDAVRRYLPEGRRWSNFLIAWDVEEYAALGGGDPTGNLKYYTMSREELYAEAAAAVDRRLARWAEVADDKKGKSWVAFAGILSFGDVESPREDQIQNYMRWHTPHRGEPQDISFSIERDE